MQWENLVIPSSPQALFLRLAEGIRKCIQQGDLSPGEWLPSSRVLSETLKIHRHTITAALDELVAEGWLAVEKRKGYQVLTALPAAEEFTGAKSRPYPYVRQVELGGFSPGEGVRYNFQSGLADLRMFPVYEYKRMVSEALREDDPELLDYGNPLGINMLREELKEYVERMRGIRDREIIVTIGSQEAIFITSQLLLGSGDYVAMEELSYPPAKEAFRLAGAKVVSVQMDEHGMAPDALLRQIKRHAIKMIFLTPTHQFPTTLNMPASRRLEIYGIASENGVIILEDDYDHEFHFTSTPPQPMAALDPSSLIVYTSTFSKLLFPSARLAFMAVTKDFAKQFAQYRRITTHQNDAISQKALALWMRDKGLLRHFKKMSAAYESRLHVLDHALRKLRDKGAELSWSLPDGGMALWLNLHRNADEFVQEALRNDVFLTPESYYRVRKGTSQHVRVGFSNQNESEITAGMAAIAKLLLQ